MRSVRRLPPLFVRSAGWAFLAAPVAAIVVVVGCPPGPVPPAPPDGPPSAEAGPRPTQDAIAPSPAPPGPDAGPCALAYWHLASGLACPPPAPAGGGSWTDVCETERAHAHTFGLPCLAAATSCAAARRCLAGTP